VRTGSCAQRFKLTAPARVGLGTRALVRLVDRWNIGGIGTRLCITPPRGRKACRAVRFPRAVNVKSRRFHAKKKGLWKVALRVHGHRIRTAVRVGAGRVVAESPIVLTTGDSTMQGVDHFLADRLGETARVVSDVHHGTNISRGTESRARRSRRCV